MCVSVCVAGGCESPPQTPQDSRLYVLSKWHNFCLSQGSAQACMLYVCHHYELLVSEKNT